jgi:aryl carrier-like protein
MKKAKVYTEQMAEDFALNEWAKLVKRKTRAFKKKIITQCSKKGLRMIELQYDWFKENPLTELPIEELDHKETLTAWQEAITEYRNDIKI